MLAAALLAMLSPGVEIRAEPAALRLDRQISAELTFRAAAGPLAVECSAGKMDQLRETSPGEWHAVWRAPKTLVPQVVLIVARRGDAIGFLALPLSGGGDAEVRTRPGAVVSVNIGVERFGPIRAGADGTALVPVVVPPGVDYAQQGERFIDLHVPRTRTVQLAPVPSEIAVDRDVEVEIAIAAVSRGGQPLPDPPLELTVSRGAVSAAEALAPGLFRARWRIPAGPPGEARVQATVSGDPSPSEIAVRLVPGGIASIELQPVHEAAVAAGAAIELSALAVDVAGNGTDDAVDFFASAGTLSTSAAGQGRYRLLLTPPPELDDAAEVTVTASARGAGEATKATLRVPLVRVLKRVDESQEKTRGLSPVAAAVRAGFFTDGHGLDAPVLGLEGGLRRQWRATQVGLVFDLWWARARQTTAVSSTLIDSRDDFLVASIAGGLRWPLSGGGAVWAQAGAAMVAAFANVGVSGQTRADATSRGAVPAIEIGLGAERRMWGGVPFLEARILRTRSFALPNLVGALTAFTICAGYRLEML